MTTNRMSARSRPLGALQEDLHGWWNALPEAVRTPAWPASLAALVILALLLGFHQVVHQSVRQGEVLRMSASTHADATWRCKALASERMRARCLAELNAPAAHRTPPPNTASLQSADAGG